MEKKTTLLNHSLIWGAILGIALIIFSIITWFLDILPSNFLIIILLFLINMIIMIIISAIGTLKFRNSILEGKISFGTAFSVGLLIIISATILTNAYSVLFTKVIDPTYVERSMEATKNWTAEFMAKKGVPDEQIEKTIKKMDEKGKPSAFKSFYTSLIVNTIVGSIICLIIAAIVKKEDSQIMT